MKRTTERFAKLEATLNDLKEKEKKMVDQLQTLESTLDDVIFMFGLKSPAKEAKEATLTSEGIETLSFTKWIDRNDDISKCIMRTISIEGPLNISHITNHVRRIRGKASRRIVRQRINHLLKKGYLVKGSGKVPTYTLAPEAVKMWPHLTTAVN